MPRRRARRLISILRRVNLFPRLLLVFCTLLIASAAFITFFNQQSYSREVQDNTEQYLAVLVQNAAMKLAQERDRIEAELIRVTQNERLLQLVQADADQLAKARLSGNAFTGEDTPHRAEIETLLRSGKQRVGGVKALMIVSPEAQYRMASDPDGAMVRDVDALYQSALYAEAVALNGYPAWRDASGESGRLFAENEQDRLGLIDCVTVSIRLLRPDTKQPVGMFICCLYPRHFADTLTEYAGRDGGNNFLVGSRGLVEGIAASLSAPPFVNQYEGLLRRVFAQHRGSMLMETAGKTLLVSFAGEESFPLHIVNLTDRDYALRSVNRLALVNLMILLIVVLAGTLVIYLTAASVVRPVHRLIRAMKRVGAGDFSAVYRAESKDEIGVLCEEFDRMVADMKALIDRVYVSEIREKNLALNEKIAQLDALQMRINPHFLYNTLDMIRWQCLYENGGESAASDMIEQFCALLRMTIQGDGLKESVAQSLLHADTYLKVVNFRNSSKIRLETELGFDPAAYRIPRLCLQPMLENAVRHGFASKTQADPVIRIVGGIRGGVMTLTVRDNGVGMTERQLTAIRRRLAADEISASGIGLNNVHQRCRLCYGGSFGLTVHSAAGGGTTVTLTIPQDAMEESDVSGSAGG